MKFSLTCFLWIIVFSKLTFTSALTTTHTETIKHTTAEDPEKEGFWSRHTTWKSRWVKYWHQKSIYVPVWKKVWSPVVQNEWVPLPNTPLDWPKSSSGQHKISELHY